MTRRTVAFAAFLFAALAARLCSVPASAETPSGAVYVTSLPTGADIWIDGTYVGRAPMLVDALAPGHHALTIARTGWVVQEVDVSVPLGGVALSTTHLVAGPRAFSGTATGSIVLRQVPAGASLQLDGANLDPQTGKPIPLTAGSHHIVIVTPKGRSTRTFTVLPDTSTELVLRADQSAPGSRSAVVAPADDYVGADAYTIEGQKIVVRSNGHLVVAHFGDTAVRYDGSSVSYDSAPTSIAGKLYLPLALLEKLSDDASKAAH